MTIRLSDLSLRIALGRSFVFGDGPRLVHAKIRERIAGQSVYRYLTYRSGDTVMTLYLGRVERRRDVEGADAKAAPNEKIFRSNRRRRAA